MFILLVLYSNTSFVAIVDRLDYSRIKNSKTEEPVKKESIEDLLGGKKGKSGRYVFYSWVNYRSSVTYRIECVTRTMLHVENGKLPPFFYILRKKTEKKKLLSLLT